MFKNRKNYLRICVNIFGDYMANYHNYRIGKIRVTLWLDTKTHKWSVIFGDASARDKLPDMQFTKAKGKAVFDFVKKLEEKQTHTPST